MDFPSLDYEQWNRKGILIAKSLFASYRNGKIIILTLVFIDKNGKQFELCTSDPEKAYYYDGVVHENHFYNASGFDGFSQVDERFSTSLESSRCKEWSLSRTNKFPLLRHLRCSIELEEARLRLKENRPVNLVACFQWISEGPEKYSASGELTVKGWFVAVTDKSNELFRVLVWYRPSINKSDIDLFYCDKGDPVLFVACRPLRKLVEECEDYYTITTLYEPVVEPACVSRATIKQLTHRY